LSDADVIQSLLGNMPLPWELDGGMFEMIANQDARTLIKCLLRFYPPFPTFQLKSRSPMLSKQNKMSLVLLDQSGNPGEVLYV